MTFPKEDLSAPLDPEIRFVTTPVRGFQGTRHELTAGDEVLSVVTVIDFQQRFQEAWLRMGGIADVFTPDRHRGKGYSRRCLDHANRWMQREQFDTSMLFGIGGDFYPKFGYAEAFPDYAHSIAVAQLRYAGPGLGAEVVPYDPKRHGEAVFDLYRASAMGFSGVVRRSRDWLSLPVDQLFTEGKQVPLARVFLKSGRPVAYAVWFEERDGEFRVMELGYDSPEVFPDLWRAAAEAARALGREKVFFTLPPQHPFVEYLERYGALSRAKHRRDGGAMVRLLNLRSALEKFAPVLASRLRPKICESAGAMVLRTSLGDACLSWRDGEVKVSDPREAAAEQPVPEAELTQQALTQMLYGYRRAEALHVDGILRAPDRAIELLEAFFPPAPHFFWFTDNF